ncbi:MAG TPA: efflux RND transporter permease subunit [Longimicrobiales bacterium]|nr:efflux RND transporter permease subunit [Longimicrobiales bacterium]
MIRLAIRRPVAVTMAYVAIALLGVAAWRNIPLELLPNTQLPQLSIQAGWPGSSPEAVEAFVTSPIEGAVQQIRGVEKVTSTSQAGRTDIQVQFSRATDMDFARLELSERLAALREDLPARVRPVVIPYVPREFREQQKAFLTYTVTGPYTPEALRAHVQDVLAPEITQVSGVNDVEVEGGRDRLLEIELDPRKVEALGLYPQLVQQRIAEMEFVKEAGFVEVGGRLRTVAIRHRAESVQEVLDLPVLTDLGRIVRLEDVARAHDTYEDPRSFYRIDGFPAVSFTVHKELGTNVVDLAAAVKARLAAVEELNPPGTRLILDEDESEAVETQLSDLRTRAIVAAVVIFLVLLLFLRSLRSAGIVFTTIAFSILITLNLIYFGGLTLNVLTLMGIAMGFGLIVDNAIVVLENVYRRRRMGDTPVTAADRGAREVVLPILAATLTTVVVLIPFVYLQGELQVYYVPLAIVVGFSLMASLFVAFSFIPGLASRILGSVEPDASGRALPQFARAYAERVVDRWEAVDEKRLARRALWGPRLRSGARIVLRPGRWRWGTLLPWRLGPALSRIARRLAARAGEGGRRVRAGFAGLVARRRGTGGTGGAAGPPAAVAPAAAVVLPPWYIRLYAGLVGFTLRHPVVTVVLALAMLGGSYNLFDKYVTRGVLWGNWWGQDNYIDIQVRMPRGEEIERVDNLTRYFEEKLKQIPEVERFVTRVYPSYSRTRVEFPDSIELTNIPVNIKEQMVAYSHQFGGMDVRVYGYGPSFYGGGSSPPNYSIQIYGYNYEKVREIADDLGQRLTRFSRIREVDTNSAGRWNPDKQTELVLDLDRRKLALHDLSARDVVWQVAAATRSGAGGDPVRIGGEELLFAVKLEGNRDLDLLQLQNLLIPSRTGSAVRLGDVARLEERNVLSRIEREDQRYRRYVAYEFRGPTKLGDVIRDAVVANTYLPPGYELETGDTWRWDIAEQKQIYGVLGLSIFLVFMVTAALFESVRQPLTVLLTVPMALVGVFMIFFYTGASFTREAYVGVIMMGGIVVNNSILLVDHVNHLRRTEGMALEAATVRGTLERVRPILMTSATTILGLLPLVLFSESANENIWNALAYALIGGLASSTILVLTVTPTLYMMFERAPERRRVARLERESGLAPAPTAPTLLPGAPGLSPT